MDPIALTGQARPPRNDTTNFVAKRLTGIMPLVIGGNWMLVHNGVKMQLTALDMHLVREAAKEEGRELSFVWRDLSTGRDYESPEAHRAAYPSAAQMKLANQVSVGAWFCADYADPQAQKKADAWLKENTKRRKLVADLESNLDKCVSIDELDAATARIASINKLIESVEEKRKNVLGTIVGLVSERWHPDLEVPTADVATAAPNAQ